MTPSYGPDLRQPDQRSCGAACVVVARLLRSTGPSPDAAAFARDVLDTHRRLVRPVDTAGRAQLPWPAGLGTPPWAVARALGSVEGVRYTTRVARWAPGPAYDAAADAVRHHPVALYVGSALIPRHVLLATGAGPDGLAVYDPASGGQVTVTRAAFAGGRLRVAGWDVPWFVVRA